MRIEVKRVDYADAQQCRDIGYLLNYYAMDPMGGGQALDSHIIANIARELAKLPHAFSILCYVNEQAAGLVNCFDGFSTFHCKPLVNIHDIVVLPEYRGRGISQLLLQEVETIAREKGCCKLTLEVLEGNQIAQKAYSRFGFSDYVLDLSAGKALFWQKML